MAEVVAEAGRPPRRVAPYIALAVALVLGGLFYVLATGDSNVDDEQGLIESPLLDRVAPAVRTTTLDGTGFDLSRRKGSWVVFNFFNSTCVPCKAEHPELVEFVEQQRSFGSEGAEFYTVLQVGDSIDSVKEFFLTRGGDWPILRDDDGAINVDFGVAQVPETFVIDPSGVVRLRWAGQIDADTLSLLVQQLRDGMAVGG